MITVVCVLWMGEFENRKYSPEWVYRLRDIVTQWLSVPFRFVCLSNVDVPGVEVILLKMKWPGWWAKVEIFNPGIDLGERALYLDLDTFVTGDLAPIANFDAPMALMPPAHVFMGTEPRLIDGVVRQYQASCIVWNPPEGREIFEKLTPEMMERLRSDQDWIGYIKPDCATMPKEWFAKARQCRHGVPEGVRVVLAQRTHLLGRTLADVAEIEAARG